VAATLSKSSGSVTISYARIQDNTATGGATFTANNSVDLGNVTGWTIPVIQPTTQTSSLFSISTVINSIELKWTNGDGAKRVVVARASSAVNLTPVDGASYASAAFGSGTNLGSSNYVVYSGNEDRAVITGLLANTTYYFKVFEFNGSGSSTKYLTTSPPSFNDKTLLSTAVVISNTPVSICSDKYYPAGGSAGYNDSENFTQTLSSSTPGSKLRLTFTDFFTIDSHDVLSIYDGADINSPLIGSYSGSNSPGIVTATNAAGKLTVRFVSDAFSSSTGWLADISCTVLDTQPTIAPSGVNFSNVSSTAMTVGWTNGNGGKRIVIARAGVPVSVTPTDGTEYSANSVYGTGADLGSGNFVVYNGTGNQVNITGLSGATSYYFSVFEYAGANTSSNYLSTAGTGNQSTQAFAPEPTVSMSNYKVTAVSRNSVSVSWTNGNGERRLIMAVTGTGTFESPVDGTTYTANAAYGSGDKIGDIGYVVYDGTGSSATITNLNPNTVYWLYIIEYNGSGSLTNYYLDGGSSYAQTLKYKPTVQASHLTVSKVTANSAKLSWTRGDGDYVLIVGR
jgi:hypothetical protein